MRHITAAKSGSGRLRGWAPLLAGAALLGLLSALLPTAPTSGSASGSGWDNKVASDGGAAAPSVPCCLDPAKACTRCPPECCGAKKDRCCCLHIDRCTCPRPEDIPSPAAGKGAR